MKIDTYVTKFTKNYIFALLSQFNADPLKKYDRNEK